MEMDESGRAGASLEVSVSFGRFENDSLSWEKWSSFSPNKYLEEVGKYSTPGSVAQKKAYFEAHYKKIAAKKAEQSEQDKPITSPPTPTRDESEKKNHVKLTYVGDEELELSSNGRSGEDLDLEEAEIESPPCRSDNMSQIEHTSVKDGEFDVFSNGRAEGNLDQDDGSDLNVNPMSFMDGKEDAAIGEDRQECSTMETEEKLNDDSNNIESIDDKEETKDEVIQNKPDIHLTAREETANILEKTPHTVSRVTNVEPSSKGSETNGTLVKKNKNMKVSARDTARKMTLPKRELNPPEAKKKVASPLEARKIVASPLEAKTKVASPPVRKSLTTSKFLHQSTAGLSKSTIMPVSQPSTKKTIRASTPKSSFTSSGEHKRTVPASLNMSMSLNNEKPLASAMPIRKSLIMEQMGDKDIVKRAFKTFQKHLNGVPSLNSGISNGKQQMSGTDSEQKVTKDSILQKENERLRRSVEKKTNQRGGGDLGNRSNHSPLVSHKGSGAERKKPISESPSTKLKYDAKFEKQKQKTFTQEVGKALPAAKTNVEKEANLKKSKQGLNFKATVTPPYNRANMKPRTPTRKEDDTKSLHQPISGR